MPFLELLPLGCSSVFVYQNGWRGAVFSRREQQRWACCCCSWWVETPTACFWLSSVWCARREQDGRVQDGGWSRMKDGEAVQIRRETKQDKKRQERSHTKQRAQRTGIQVSLRSREIDDFFKFKTCLIKKWQWEYNIRLNDSSYQ